MVKFARLRLNGFKSFVDRTELDIQAGLTGIVGPNGCGKSNLVEALRWVMGANNARLLRGESMDDVIFNGSGRRPARNHAEVAIVLDNADHKAPAPYTASSEIEIVRRIDRDQGSSYSINGRPARARDVQTLFADLTSGASSAAMVGQGRVTSIINAKAHERRALLEEAAGVSGLYARRQEAEQRLKAADENMNRMQETISRLEGQSGYLKKQARQAARYRELNDQVKQLEQQLALLQWQAAVTASLKAGEVHREADRHTAESLRAVVQLQQTAQTMADSIKPLQIAAAESKAALQTLLLSRQQKQDDVNRLAAETEELNRQLAQLEADQTHEQSLLAELETSLAGLARESKTLGETLNGAGTKRQEAESAVEKLKATVQAVTAKHQAALTEQARQQARANDMAASIVREERRLQNYQDRLNALKQIDENALAGEKAESLALEKQLTKLADAIAKATAAENASFEAIASARKALDASRAAQKTAREDESRTEIEMKPLLRAMDALAEDKPGKGKPVLSDITVEEGYELALARALGETLQAPAGNKGDHGWNDLGQSPEFSVWPQGVKPMADMVSAPAVLGRALSQIGVVDAGMGATVQAKLQAGQILVSREGYIWRWDGYASRRTAADQATTILQQKTRLAELQAALPALIKARELSDVAVAAAEKALADAESGLGQRRSERAAVENEQRTAQQRLHQLRGQLASLEAEKQATDQARNGLNDDIALVTAQLKDMRKQQAELEAGFAGAELAASLAALAAELAEHNEQLQEAVTKRQMLEAEEQRQKARLQAIGDERLNAQNRQIRAKEQLSRIAERIAEADKRRKSVKQQPETLMAAIATLSGKIASHEEDTSALADKLAHSETELLAVNASLKAAEVTLMQARENSARFGERAQAADNRKLELTEKLTEDYGQSPLVLEQQVSTEGLTEHQVQTEKEKLVRAREALGPVNLLAEKECDTVLEELNKLVTEREDLTQAIAELRHAVGKLNSEARERLQNSFVAINGHFERLFQTLFKGGHARLALIDSDDPLAAGLEIFAQPPGKALQSLSLLSGGEQTLTAVALIFAMFLVNPAPLCVLDEIDAPLDDANVDRVCDLLEQIALEGHTRFLIITHHRLTMARMHRLFGVTMAEQGVSQLLSLELQSSFNFREREAA